MRVEAVNFASFIGDTFDLSTVRGAGLLLLNAPDALSSELHLTKVYAGASSAIYRFQADGEDQAARICRDAEGLLHADGRSAATILVVSEAFDDADFSGVMNRLQNKIRWRQLQSPSLIYPTLNSAEIDELDDLRPAVKRASRLNPPEIEGGKGTPMVLSDATFQRRSYGIDQKRCFYASRAWAGAPWASDFPFHTGEYVNDFNQLADCPGKGRTNGKIALIYLDGNKFGQIASSCRSPDEVSNWANTVQANQNSFLHWLLSLRIADSPRSGMTSWHWSGRVQTNSGYGQIKNHAFRIETLLWGGDEIIWIVPAWCGWWVLTNFFDLYGTIPWKEPGVEREFTTDRKYRLSHGASIVFSHSNAPIHRLIRLAKHLAEEPKRLGTHGLRTENYQDYFTYQVLESFDHLGDDPEKIRALRMPYILRTAGADSLTLSGDGMKGVLAGMEKVRSKFPRSKLHRLLDLYCNHPDSAPNEQAEKELKNAGTTDVFTELSDYFGATAPDEALKNAAAWMHIAELWDYTPEPDWKACEIGKGVSA